MHLEWLEDRSLPAPITFAQFQQLASGQNFNYTHSGTTARFNTISRGDPVSVNFDTSIIQGLTSPQQAHLFLTSSTTSQVINLGGGLLSESFPAATNTLQITLDTPVGGHSNFLTVTYSDSLFGTTGSQSGSLQAASDAGDTVR